MVNISLTASMRSNLLSLQSIASQQDLVQNRLATGLKVSSAIDNPSSYYTAQSLNNRASDLTQLLDSMSQGIQTLKAVSETITSATKFLEQAKAVANQAMENTQPIVARVSSEADLQAALASDKRGLIVIDRDIVMSTNSNIVLKDGQSLVGAKYLDKTARQTSISFNFNNDYSSGINIGNNSLVSDLEINISTENALPYKYGYNNAINVNEKKNVSINNVNINNNKISGLTESAGIFISSNSEVKITGKINIITKGNAVFGIALNNSKLDIVNANLNISTNGLSSYGIYSANNSRTNITDNSRVNIKTTGNNAVGIKNFFSSSLNILNKSIINMDIEKSSAFVNETIGANNIYIAGDIKINAKAISLFSNTASNAGNINTINILSGVNISWNNINTGVQGVYSTTSNWTLNNVNIINDLDGISQFSKDSNIADIIPDIDDEMAKETKEDNKDIVKESYQYNSILNQFDMIIKDSSYKGVNLLLGQSLKVNFNEDRSSKLDITGVNASTNGLGLNDASWKNQENVEASISELDSAISDLRQYASEFGNYYSIVSNREEFTNNLVNVLTEGADKLTLADMNQESANMLALQTAQSLAINSLSLASQASQSILKLF